MGAAAVLETAAETPPMRKSMTKWLFSAGAATKIGEAVVAAADKSIVALHVDIIGFCNAAFE